MFRPSLRAIAGVAIAFMSLTACGLNAKGLSPVGKDERPGLLAYLNDGRALNLRCGGRGSPTVLLESGFGASSTAWPRVMPELRKLTRVCAYDRAGYGFSDPGPQPRDGAAIARDLDQALTNAGVQGPFVVVGHSAGGLYGRLFAARHPQAVVGLVLLDPTVENLVEPGTPDGLDGIRRRVRNCLSAAQTNPPLPPQDDRWSGCGMGRDRTAHGETVARRPGTWTAQLSELDNLFTRTSVQVIRTRGLLANIPAYVLTASETADRASALSFGEVRSLWTLGHLRIAGESRLGYQQTIRSSHLIMKDRPDAVIAAAREMVLASRQKRPPAPLEPSETDVPSETIAPDQTAAPANPFDTVLTPEAK